MVTDAVYMIYRGIVIVSVSLLLLSGCKPGASMPVEQPDGIQEVLLRKQCMSAPFSTCTAESSCLNSETGEVFNSPSLVPDCTLDGGARSFVNEDGVTRFYCHVEDLPNDGLERPLVVFMHGGTGKADDIYGPNVELRVKASSYSLKPQVVGFHLVSLQARNTNAASAGLNPGRHHDTYWWDFNSPSTNPDIRDVDQLINELVSNNNIDSNRIYFIGWSQGAMFSQMYGFARHERASPFGHKVAAASLYSGSSPIIWRFEEGAEYCSTDLDFTTKFPIQITARSCDLPCNQAQADYFLSEGEPVSGLNLEAWQNILIQDLQNPNTEFNTIDFFGNPSACMPVGSGALECNSVKAWVNHAKWPTGSEVNMLNFLRDHPLEN